MKRIQKLIGITLILILLTLHLFPILNVKAETITVKGTNDENVREDLVINNTTITVNGVDSSDSFTAYKVLDVFYNSSTNEVSYEFTTNFNTFLNTDSIKTQYSEFSVEKYMELTSDYVDTNGVGQASASVITTSTLNVLISKYATYVKENNISGDPMTTSATIATGNVVAGSYLILPSEINGTYTYGAMVANATPSIENGVWVISSPQISAKKSTNEGDYQFILIDASSTYFAENIIDISSGNIAVGIYADYKGFSINKGFTIDFLSEIPAMPTNAINKVWKTEIIYPTGLDLNLAESYSIVNGYTVAYFSNNKVLDDTGNAIATLTEDTIEQTENGEAKTYNRLTITADYSVLQSRYEIQLAFGFTLNDNATIGGSGNEIRKVVTYTEDPYVLNSTRSYESSLIAYTYGMEITSYGEQQADNSYPLLTGGEYEVYSDETLGTKVGEIIIDENGEGVLKGLADGTYYLKQTKTPTGYQLAKEPIEVEVATETAVDSDNDGYYETTIYNETLWFLPTTGGIGTIIYTIIGLLIISAAAFGTVYYRKNQLKTNN